MKTLRRSVIGAGLLTLVLVGCSGAAAPSTSGTPSRTDPPPTRVPGGRLASGLPPDTGNGGGAVGGGGTVGGVGAGGSAVVGGGGGVEPNPAQPQLVVPKPGTLNRHSVSIERLDATVDGRSVTVIATWTSGVEPCNVLDSVAVKQDGNAFTVAVVEGSANRDAMCIEIAVQKATVIQLGELAPGDYTVSAQGGTAPAVSFTVA